MFHLMRFEHLRGAAHKISKAVAFDAKLRLRWAEERGRVSLREKVAREERVISPY